LGVSLPLRLSKEAYTRYLAHTAEVEHQEHYLPSMSWPRIMAMALLAGHMKKYRPDTVAAGEFKNSCLKIIDEVSKHGLPVTVTRRGKPLVRIVPARERSKTPSLKGTVVHEDADIFSTGESWDAER